MDTEKDVGEKLAVYNNRINNLTNEIIELKKRVSKTEDDIVKLKVLGGKQDVKLGILVGVAAAVGSAIVQIILKFTM